MKRGVAITGRNTTGLPAIMRLETAWRHHLACMGVASSSLIIVCRGVLQMMTDAREENILAPLHYV